MGARAWGHVAAGGGAIAFLLGVSGTPAASAPALSMGQEREAMVCTWGGTPAATTGTFTIKPGLTLTPAAEPLEFIATGRLDGGERCEGKLTFDGVIHAGGTCAVQVFEGEVRGLPGVERFFGPGAGGFVNEFLYDGEGNVVGADQPQVLSGATRGGSEVPDCNTAKGFTHGHFSSVVEVWG
jgi:hypothetical protein